MAVAAVLSAGSSLASCQTATSNPGVQEKPAERRGTHVWIERHWEARYFLLVSDSWEIKRSGAAERNTHGRRTSLEWPQLFEPIAAVPIPKPSASYPLAWSEHFSVVVIQFDQQGMVISPNSSERPLRGRLNRLRYMTLATGDEPTDVRYNLGIWFTGIGDASTDWAPGICPTNQQPDPAQIRSEGYLYGKLFKPDPYKATFGCREWAYQLYDNERPYIDVTSYVPKAQDPDGPGTYIHEFIGWARFGDKKPVIGRHKDDWYCLHDCPGGDKPGIISDIKVWAIRNGWAVPKRPTRVPVFPDPPASLGTYPK